MSAHLNVDKQLSAALKQCLKNTLSPADCQHDSSASKSMCLQRLAKTNSTASGDLKIRVAHLSKHSRLSSNDMSDKLLQIKKEARSSASPSTASNESANNTVDDSAAGSSAANESSSEAVDDAVSGSAGVPSASILKRTAIVALLAVLLAAAAVAGKNIYEHFSSFQETEDAYVTGHLHQVSSRVSGTVQQVLVDDNQHVKEGQALVLLDPRDFQIKIDAAKADLKQAEQQVSVASSSVVMADATEKGNNTNAQGGVAEALATIASAQSAVEQAETQISAARADLKAKEAELERAKSDLTRYETLLEQGAVSTQQKDFAMRDYKVSQENFNASKDHLIHAVAGLARSQQTVLSAKAQLVQSQAQVQIAKASSVQTVINENQKRVALAAVEKAKASLSEAAQNLQYTVIPAPTSGRVGNKTVELGQRITPGQALLSIVSDKPWVVANFKETQLSKMKIGQPVEVKIDSFPEHAFEGQIASFAPASGASFSIIRSDNATGNFTKIVQRIPVKIILTSESTRGFEDRIVPGMSVVATVLLKSQTMRPNETVAHNMIH